MRTRPATASGYIAPNTLTKEPPRDHPPSTNGRLMPMRVSASYNSLAMTEAERVWEQLSDRPYPGRSYVTTLANCAISDGRAPHAVCEEPPGSRITGAAAVSPVAKK